MQSRFCALGALLATAALAAAGRCDESARSAPLSGNTAEQSRVPSGDGAGSQRDRSVRSAAPESKPASGKTALPPKNWRIAATLSGHKSPININSLVFSPDGSRLFSGSVDGEVKVWDPHASKELASIRAHKDGNCLRALAVSPSGEILASVAMRPPGEVKLWDARTLQLRATLLGRGPLLSLAFSRNSEWIAAGGDREVYVWSARDGRQKHKLSVGMYQIGGLAFSRDGRILYAGGMLVKDEPPYNPGILSAWEVASGKKLGEIEFPHGIPGIDLSDDGNTIAVGAGALHVLDLAIADGRVRFTERWSAIDERSQGGQLIMQEQFTCVAFSPDRRLVAGAAGSPGPLTPEAGHVALFALQDGRRIAQLQTPRPAKDQVQPGDYDIDAVAFSPDGKLLASGGKEGIITLWTTAGTE
jgi:WD40 repeat protein